MLNWQRIFPCYFVQEVQACFFFRLGKSQQDTKFYQQTQNLQHLKIAKQQLKFNPNELPNTIGKGFFTCYFVQKLKSFFQHPAVHQFPPETRIRHEVIGNQVNQSTVQPEKAGYSHGHRINYSPSW